MFTKRNDAHHGWGGVYVYYVGNYALSIASRRGQADAIETVGMYHLDDKPDRFGLRSMKHPRDLGIDGLDDLWGDDRYTEKIDWDDLPAVVHAMAQAAYPQHDHDRSLIEYAIVEKIRADRSAVLDLLIEEMQARNDQIMRDAHASIQRNSGSINEWIRLQRTMEGVA